MHNAVSPVVACNMYIIIHPYLIFVSWMPSKRLYNTVMWCVHNQRLTTAVCGATHRRHRDKCSTCSNHLRMAIEKNMNLCAWLNVMECLCGNMSRGYNQLAVREATIYT